MTRFTCRRIGENIEVELLSRPRFRLTLELADDGSWNGFDPEWIDPPPLDAMFLASLMREAGEAAELFLRTETS